MATESMMSMMMESMKESIAERWQCWNRCLMTRLSTMFLGAFRYKKCIQLCDRNYLNTNIKD